MKIFKTKKQRNIIIIFGIIVFLLTGHFQNTIHSFYIQEISKIDMAEIIYKENLSEEDLMTIFNQCGVSPFAAKELIKEGEEELLFTLQEMYFTKPEIKRQYIAFPITAEEKNAEQITPLVKLKKGDILISFSTHTLNWRHGHCAIVTDDNGTILEHLSVGNTSCFSKAAKWGKYPAFAVLRHKDEALAGLAADYASENLEDIDYNILAGIINKDKSDDKEVDGSHCSHLVWQAYKAAGADIDSDKGLVVTPEDIAMSEELEIVQIFGMDTENYITRIKK